MGGETTELLVILRFHHFEMPDTRISPTYSNDILVLTVKPTTAFDNV